MAEPRRAGAATVMRRANLPEAYAATLSSGLWDSCEILSPVEARAQGVALTEPPFRCRAETGFRHHDRPRRALDGAKFGA